MDANGSELPKTWSSMSCSKETYIDKCVEAMSLLNLLEIKIILGYLTSWVIEDRIEGIKSSGSSCK